MSINFYDHSITTSGTITSPSGNFTTLVVNGTSVSNFNSSISGLLPTIANSGDNRILTSTGSSVGINAESDLTFENKTLNIGSSGNVGVEAIINLYTNDGGDGKPAINFKDYDDNTKLKLYWDGDDGISYVHSLNDSLVLSGPTSYIGINNDGRINIDSSGVISNNNFGITNQTANTIASFDGSKNVVSLSTGTYPSLTELSYVKGVTSSIQTQLNSKTPTASPAFTGAATVTNDGNVVPLTVTNTGTANSFVVNDESGDTTPFVVDAAGRVVIGGSAPASEAHKVSIVGTLPTVSNQSVGYIQRGTVPSSSTVAMISYSSLAITDAASFTLSSFQHFRAIQSAIGAGSSITNQYGFVAHDSLTGATNNYGFYSDIASGTGRFNFYANGTAANYFAGQLLVGTTTAFNATDGIQIGRSNIPGIVIARTEAPTSTASIAGINASAYDGSAYVAGATINFRAAENWSSTNHGTDIQFRTTPTGSGGSLTETLRLTAAGQLLVTAGSGSAGSYKPGVAVSGDDDTGLQQVGGANTISLVTAGSERVRVDASGNVGIGTSSPDASTKVNLAGTYPTSGTVTRAILCNGLVPSGSTVFGDGLVSFIGTVAASFTCANLRHFVAAQGSIGAGSSVTSQFGYVAESSLTGATNNYGFYSNIASGTGRWNFYANGTAANYFAGNVGIGVTPAASTTSNIQSSGDITLYGGSRGFLGNLYFQSGWKYAGTGYGWGWIDSGSGNISFQNTTASGNASDSASTLAASLVINASRQLLVTAGSGSAGSYKPGVAISGDDDTGLQQVGGANTISLVTAGSERVRVDASGQVLVGTTNADPIGGNVEGVVLGPFFAQLSRSGALPLLLNRKTNDGDLAGFWQDGAFEGSISVSNNTVSYNAFCGSHWAQLIDGSRPAILRGTVLETIDEMCEWPEGKSDRLVRVKVSDTPRSRRVYGVFMAWDEEYASTGDMYATALGAYMIRVYGLVQSGDLLESAGDGTARSQSDDIIRSSTIGKVSSTYRITEYDDGSYLVPCVLMCG